MRKKVIFYGVLILLLLGGCSKEISESIDEDAPINSDGSIAFRTDSVLTRGTPQDNLTAYQKVNLLTYSHTDKYAGGKALYRQIDLKKEGSNPPKWNYAPPMFWPEGRGLSFLAYTIENNMVYATASGQEGVFIKNNGTTTAPTIEYFVPTDVKKHPDLLVTAQLDHPTASNVTLNMKHALSCVSFCATLPAGVAEMKVKNIKLKNIYTKGTLPLDNLSMTWTLAEGSKSDLTVREPGIDPDKPLVGNPGSNNNYLMTANGYMMLLPQTLKNTTIEVTYLLKQNTGDIAKEKITTYTLPTDIVWEPGKKYIYKFGEDLEEVVVYYEKYADGTYGFQNYKNKDLNPLNDTKEIVEAGYGVVTKSTLVSETPTIRIEGGNTISTSKVSVPGGYTLYSVSQTGNTFTLPATSAPVALYFDNNAVACGKIIPHFAKGVNDWNPPAYYIRTPQQMRNISALTTTGDFNPSSGIYNQERDLDFSAAKSTIGGGALNAPVVDNNFSGTYNGSSMSISNVTINATADYIGLFSRSHGQINDVVLKSSSITGYNVVGGIVGNLYGSGGAVTRPRVIGTENTATGRVTINGINNVGGIVGTNNAFITGDNTVDNATEITVATVSGWVNITGSEDMVGGIVGRNEYGATRQVLVNGVYVTGTNLGELQQSKIVIKGANYVGGISGRNDVEITGNVVGTGNDIKNMPDVAGVVEIRGISRIGGIVGINTGTGKMNAVNVRLGRAPAMIIEGTDINVGGIVGENNGTLGVQSTKTFISTRGNIEITGRSNVGGIVGFNGATGTLEHCFVYDFYSQGSGTKTYYAPKIKSVNNNAGGIVGANFASIKNSSVFSANKDALLSISSDRNNAGGITGTNISGGKTEMCSVVGKIEVVVRGLAAPAGEPTGQSAGGIAGDNKVSTTISECWIGSSDGYNIIANAVANLGLVITAPGVIATFGQPIVTGNTYIGGIVGLNDGGIIDGITLKDNVTIGRKDNSAYVGDGSNWVGGIAGGNTASYQGTNSIIRNCTVENTATTSVTIQGARNLGGIVGLNNGVVSGCSVTGVTGNYLKIIGLGTIGGIVGQHGGNSALTVTPPLVGHSGNDYTAIKNCHVKGFVTLQGDITEAGYETATDVGGIAGITGPNIETVIGVENCSVGKTGAVDISVSGVSGGIVGTNAARVKGCDVYNATIKSTIHPGQSASTEPFAGGIVGMTITNSTVFNSPPGKFCSDINDCRVYSATITSFGWGVFVNTHAGALAGNLNSDIAFAFGTTMVNQVNSSGVIVNNGNRPTTNNFIVGTAIGDGLGGFASIRHTVTVVPARP